MATERIQIIVTSKGTVTVRKEIDSVGTSATRAAGGMDLLKGALASIISGATIMQISRLADEGINLSNALTVAGLSGQQFVATQNELFSIAKANGQNVNELAGIYQRLNSVQGQLGIGQEGIIEALKNIAAGFKISSASAGAQSGALQQLQQLLGGTVVQMQEVNSLVDGAFPILQAVARGTEEFGGNVGALINRLREGGYSVKAFFDGLQRGSDINRELAANWNLSIGQALTNFRTNLIQTLLAVNQSTGAFYTIAAAINFMGNNLGLMTALISPLIIAITTLAVRTIGGLLVSSMYGAAGAIGSVISAMGRLLLLAAANPFTALIVGVTLVIAYFIDWEKAIQNVVKAVALAIMELGRLLNNEGMFLKGKEIFINADAAVEALKSQAEDLKNKITTGGATIPPPIEAALKNGGNAAANSIANGMASGAQMAANAQAAALANYENLNGKAVQEIGNAHVEGGKFIYNQVTGGVQKAAPEMKTAVETGGNIAGAAIEKSMNNGAKTIYNTVESAFATLGNILDVIDQAIMNMRTERAKMRAETAKLNAETDAIRRKADDDHMAARYGGGGGSSGGSSSGGGGASGIRMTAQQLALRNGRNRGQETPEPTPAGPQVVDRGEIEINNILDAGSFLAAINTVEGRKTVMNLIKNNREDFQAVLGVI